MEAVEPDSFADDENWRGGFYELGVVLGRRDDERLDAAIRAVWADPQLEGCWADRTRGSDAHLRLVASLSAHGAGHLRGVAQLPTGPRVVCGTVVIREEDSGLDWVDFYLPLGSLARVDSRVGGFPFGQDGGAESLAWRAPIDTWLASMGERVYAAVPFEYALIGFEISGEPPPEAGRVDRYVGCLMPRDGRLDYVPATR